MSEEAAEPGHKQLRKFRLQHTRKDSRLHAISDLYGYLLVSSDPLISSIGAIRRRQQYRAKVGQVLPETVALLAEPEQPSEADICSSPWGSDSSSDGDSDSSSYTDA